MNVKQSAEAGLPLRSLMTLPAFSTCKVIAGHRGLERAVTSITIMDSPDFEKYTRPNQLLVTNCFAIKDSDQMMRQLVETASNFDLAGICIKPKRFINEIPDFMVEVANRRNIPLIELSQEIRFDELIREMYSALLDNQSYYLQYLHKVNDILLKMVVEGVRLDAIAQTLANFIGNSVLIVDTLNHREFFCLSKGKEALSEEQRNEIVSTIKRGGLRDECYIKPLIVSNKRYGQIYVWESEHPSSDFDIAILNELSLVLALEISREYSLRKVENDHFSNYLIHLFNDKIINEENETHRAGRLGLDVSIPHVVARVNISRPNSKDTRINDIIIRNYVLDEIVILLQNRGIECHVAMENNSYLFLMCHREGQPGSLTELRKYIATVCSTVQQKYSDTVLRISCGSAYTGIRGLIRSYREALIVSRTIDNTKNENTALFFQDIGLYRFIYSENPSTEVKNYIDETIGKLLAYSQGRNNELLLTLRSYFECLGNLNKMSKQLFTHYNTVVYRIKRIEEITGLQFTNEADRFRLEVAFKLYEMTETYDLKL